MDATIKWRDCKTEPPIYSGDYVVLILENNTWKECFGQYSLKGHPWELWIDGFGWSSDSGYEPSYWIALPPEPPIPYNGPICQYYKDECCVGQKNAPYCYCQGNKEKCDKK